MPSYFRAGRMAAALSMFATFFVSPAQATTQTAPRVEQTFQAPSAAVQWATQVPQGVSTTAQLQAPPATTAMQQPLEQLVANFIDQRDQDAEQLCLAKAVYFEARGESLHGQLAVAEVVLNRAASGRYPATICGVVTQPWQFSFIRGGRFPAVNAQSESWRRALAIADVARRNLADQIPSHVLWYHANYVAPSWGRRLTRVTQIGAHIFYG